MDIPFTIATIESKMRKVVESSDTIVAAGDNVSK